MADRPVQGEQQPRGASGTQAVVYVHNQRVTCRALRVTARGLRIVPPTRAGVGAFLRINLSLPGHEGVIDVDGVVVAETEEEGYYAWDVLFHEASSEAARVLAAYAEASADGSAGPRSPESDHLARFVTGPALPRVGGQRPQRRTIPMDESAAPKPVAPPPKKRKTRPRGVESEMPIEQLDRLYRDALKDLGAESKKKKGKG